jgi:predicted flap endonuclease-1-like 5' DNA nuclease
VSDARAASQDFQTGFQRYAGIDKGTSDRLTEAFGGDVGLANASLDAVKAALGEGYNDGFAARLIEKARAVVPSGAWSLDALGLNDAQKGALFESGIATLGDFVGAARGEAGEALIGTLALAPETFDTKVTEAATGIAAAEISLASKGSLATVEGVTGDRAAKLVAAGITSAAELAGAKAEDIAAATGATLDEAAAVIAGARDKTGGALEINQLKNVLNLDDDSAAKLTEAGITTVADLSKADKATLGGIVNDATFANKLTDSASMLLNKTTFKRMR